jgi:hypothetical protein
VLRSGVLARIFAGDTMVMFTLSIFAEHNEIEVCQMY